MTDRDTGARIRHAREQRGLTLQDAATRTKLSVIVLQAIERNDFTSLPAGLYRRAYLRTVAVEVGLDPEPIVADYRALYEAPEAATAGATTERDPLIDELTPSPRRPFVFLVAAAVLAAAWFGLRRDVGVEAGGGESQMSDLESVAEQSQALPDSEQDRVVPHQPASDTRIAMVSEGANVPLRIKIAATDWCWAAAASDGERVLYRLVAPGEEVTLEGRRAIAVRLGNAGSVTVSINEGNSRRPGRVGEVVEIVVTPDNVEELRDAPVVTASAD